MARGESLINQSVLAPVIHLFERRNRGVKRLGKEITRSYRRVLPSLGTFLVEQSVYDASTGQDVPMTGVGAGYVVNLNKEEATYATNAHVMQGVLQGGRALLETSGVVHGVQRDEYKQQIPIDPERVWISPEHDVAFVTVDLTPYPGLSLKALEVRGDIPLPAGKPVITAGAPHAIEDTIAPQNYIAHDNLQEQAGEDGRTDMYVQLGGSINPGNSGGPTLDHSFRIPKVVGMVTLGVNGDPTTAFMLPARTIIDEYPKFRRDMQARNASVPVELPQVA